MVHIGMMSPTKKYHSGSEIVFIKDQGCDFISQKLGIFSWPYYHYGNSMGAMA